MSHTKPKWAERVTAQCCFAGRPLDGLPDLRREDIDLLTRLGVKSVDELILCPAVMIVQSASDANCIERILKVRDQMRRLDSLKRQADKKARSRHSSRVASSPMVAMRAVPARRARFHRRYVFACCSHLARSFVF